MRKLHLTSDQLRLALRAGGDGRRNTALPKPLDGPILGIGEIAQGQKSDLRRHSTEVCRRRSREHLGGACQGNVWNGQMVSVVVDHF